MIAKKQSLTTLFVSIFCIFGDQPQDSIKNICSKQIRHGPQIIHIITKSQGNKLTTLIYFVYLNLVES